MRKLLSILMTATTLFAFSCAFDETDILNRLDELENRVDKLETACTEINENISTLQALVNALQEKNFVTSVTPITEDGEVIGYTINFENGDPISIYHGEDGKDGADGKDGYTPQIGVREDADGIYYWTIDGNWLLDENGNKVKAVGLDGADGTNGVDGITPELKIENDFWYVSLDNGATWTELGKATGEDGVDGDSMFEGVEQDDDYVYIYLSDGTSIVLPKAAVSDWESIGLGWYREDAILPILGFQPGTMWEVEIVQNKHNPNLYRALNPYPEKIFVSAFGNYLDNGICISENEGYIEFDVTEPYKVVLSESPLGFMYDFGNGLDDISITPYPVDTSFGIFSDGVLTFPRNGMAIIDSEWHGYIVNDNEMFAILLPGAKFLDTDISVEYVDRIVSTDNASASAVLDFTLGADVESYCFAVVEGDYTADYSYSEVVTGMKNGSISVTESSVEQTRWEVVLPAAMYTVVAIPCANGEMKEGKAIAYRFYFPGVEEYPEVDITVAVGSVADILGNEIYEAEYPSSETFCIYMEAPGAEIESITYYMTQGVFAEDVTDEELLLEYGYDGSHWIDELTLNGEKLVVAEGYAPNTTYSFIFGFYTIYGEFKTFRLVHTTEAVAEYPEVDITVAVGSVADLTGDESNEADYPSSEAVGIYMEAPGAEIEAITCCAIEGVFAEDVTDVELLLEYGRDCSSWIDWLTRDGSVLLVDEGYAPNTTYSFIFCVKTIYGEFKTFRLVHTTAPAAEAETVSTAQSAVTEYFPIQTSYVAQKLVK